MGYHSQSKFLVSKQMNANILGVSGQIPFPQKISKVTS